MHRALKPGLGLALLLLSAVTASAAVDGTLTPGSTSSSSTTPVVLLLTGLTTGASVVVERFVDANENGDVDATEFLSEAFTVTDGQVTTIAGVRNSNIPGDEDGSANGQMSINLTPALGAELGRLAGAQLIRISSPTESFTAFTRPLTITQPAQTQTISGTVKVGVSLVPNAAVVLLDATTDGEFALGVISDATGQFTVNAPVGTYMMFAVKPGFVADVEFAPVVGLPSGAAPAQDLQLIAATTFISGTVTDAGTSAGLGGVQLFIQSQTGLAAIASTNADGTYSAQVTADQWQIETSELSLSHLGYLGLDQSGGVPADTTGTPATGVGITAPKVTALIHGTVADSSSNPLADIRLGANDGANLYRSDAITDASGHYVLGVAAGTWNAYVSSDNNPGLAGYVVPGNQSVTISAGQAIQTDFVAASVNAHLQGVVTSTNTSVSGLRIGAYNESANQYISALTALDGTFDLGVIAGTWNLQVETSGAMPGIVTTTVTTTVGVNQTLSGISVTVKSSTAEINGYVRDSGSQPVNANVYANATIAGLDYTANTQTDGSGNYTLPVIDGDWNVGANADGFMNPANVPTNISGSNETVNFTLESHQESWRASYFASTSNSGNGADLYDFDKDGIVNLLEYAFGLNPTQNSAGQLPEPQRIGSNLVVAFTAPDGVSGISYGAEWSSTMAPGSWTSIPDTGSTPQHVFSVPIGANHALFGRLKITSP